MRAGVYLSYSSHLTQYCVVKPVAQNKGFSKKNLFQGSRSEFWEVEEIISREPISYLMLSPRYSASQLL